MFASTPLIRAVPKRRADTNAAPYIIDLINRTPLGRLGQPEDIGLVATFLASDDVRWLTGGVLLVSGGLRP
ncbi:SDR family oxidoreductase [Paenibacillus gansuensis]|uniref:SDR family oxidoreductase n=1 Tax=Paenibacillus gansuensis TaxID=306542 RepID=A0ABW5PKF9_9BACL